MKLLYFAWLRQKIGKAEETLDVPAHVTQVGQLLDWLESLDDVHEVYHNALLPAATSG